MAAVLREAMAAGMQSTILPQLEAACREMFSQVYDILERGAAQSFAEASTRELSSAIGRIEEVSCLVSVCTSQQANGGAGCRSTA